MPRNLKSSNKEIHFTHIRRMIRVKPLLENDNDNEEPISLVVDASRLSRIKER
ncbi:MAG: hypothetical protein WA667_27010 [Candidatus Nitrosopolaris sp.]